MVKTFQAEDVWRGLSDVIDEAIAGHEIVIERYRKPKAVLVGYDEWQEMKTIRRREIARQRAQEMRENPAKRIPFTKEELIRQGLLDG